MGFDDVIITVEEHEKAAVLTFGKYTKTVKEAGLRLQLAESNRGILIGPGEDTVQRMEIGYREERGRDGVIVEDEAYMITGDENIVSADAVVEWRSQMSRSIYSISITRSSF